ncbi:MAG: LruC domain-containing protein [Bacteroidales bacterium]|nr:LruC domain-containing protein [Bacteroidales bacterium]
MKRNLFNLVLAVGMAALMFSVSGCSDYDNGFTEKDIEFGKDFESIFGLADPKQDWSMANVVKVNTAVSGSYLEIYSGAPAIATSKLLLSTKLGGSALAFNVVDGTEQVYAIVRDAQGKAVVQGYYDLKDNAVSINDKPVKKKEAKALATRAASNVTKGRVQENLIKVAESESLGEKYYYNGSYYTLEELREWATNNPNLNQSYYAPFNADCIVPAAWDFSNATLNESNTYVAEKEGYYHVYNKDNQNIKTIFSLDELKQFVKETYGLGAQYYCGNLFNGITVVDNELNFDNATVNESVARPITANTIVYDDKFYSWESLVDMLEKNEPANYQESNGPFLNCVIPTHLDFTNATVDLTKVSLQQEVIDKSFYINLTYLNGVEKWAADPWTLSVGAQLFGYGGFFKESVYYFDQQKTVLYGSTFDEQLEILQKIESGFSVTTKGGEIELPFIYGATGLYDQFGYVYYKEGQDPLKQPHYVLMDNATPQANIYFEGWANSGKAVWNMELSNWSEEYKTLYGKDPETKVYGTKYKLVFFGENHDQTATYEFPEGYHIVFFISPSDATPGSDTMAGYAIGDFNYSLPELNARIGHYYSNTSSLTYQQGKAPLGAVKAVAWEADGITALGFEDGGRDEDLNDVVFWLEGEFEADQELVEVEVATNNESESWIFACEDLGGLFDYDFNDVVWEVYKEYKTTTTTTTENGVSSSTTTKEFVAGKVRLLAAGGTLPVELYYNEKCLGNVHQLFGQQPVGNNLYHQVNVGAQVTTPSVELVIPDLTITATTNINDIKNNFRVKVVGDNGTSHFVTAPNMSSTAPQIILLPGEWEWPRENVAITDAYPEFTDWVQDKSWTDWARTWVTTNTVNRPKGGSTNVSGGEDNSNTGNEGSGDTGGSDDNNSDDNNSGDTGGSGGNAGSDDTNNNESNAGSQLVQLELKLANPLPDTYNIAKEGKTWWYVPFADIEAVLPNYATEGAVLVFDYSGIYGINDFFYGHKWNANTVTIKPEGSNTSFNGEKCVWDETTRQLSFVIDASILSGKNDVYWGGNTLAPKAIYIRPNN